MIKGKVVLVPFPFDDLSRTKVRPAVCLTNPLGRYRHVIVAFVTSRIPAEPLPTDLVLDPNQVGFEMTGLQVASTLCLHRLMTITTDLILRELGKLSPIMYAEARTKLNRLFDL